MELNFGNDADSMMSFLYGAYYDQNCSDSEQVQQAFDEAMNGKTLKEKDEVIYAVCRLCRSH